MPEEYRTSYLSGPASKSAGSSQSTISSASMVWVCDRLSGGLGFSGEKDYSNTSFTTPSIYSTSDKFIKLLCSAVRVHHHRLQPDNPKNEAECNLLSQPGIKGKFTLHFSLTVKCHQSMLLIIYKSHNVHYCTKSCLFQAGFSAAWTQTNIRQVEQAW